MQKQKKLTANFHIGFNEKLKQTHHKINQVQQAYFPYIPYPEQIKVINCVHNSIKNSHNALIQSPTGTGKTLCLLTGALSTLKQLNDKKIKIFYLTRTHSQISQVIDELKKTCYTLRVNIIASRDHLCINPNFRQLKGKTLQKACYDSVCNKTCLYHQSSNKKPHHPPKPIKLQQFKQQCKKQLICPFFYSRQLTQKTQISILPFNYFLDWKIFQSYQQLIKNSVIIFDQAHNVDNLAEEGYNLEISSKQIGLALTEIKLLKKKFFKGQKDQNKNINDIKIVQNIINRLKNAIDQHQKKIFCSKNQLEEFFYKSTEVVDPQNIENTIQGFQLNDSLVFFQKFNQVTKIFFKYSINSSSFSNIYSSLEKICRLFTNKQFEKNFIVKISSQQQGKNKSLRLKCLNPSIAFQKLKQFQPRSILLASGTLGNLSTFQKYIGIEFQQKLSISGFITSKQLFASILSMSQNSNYPFQFTHLRKNNQYQHKQLVEQLRIIQNVIPEKNGIVVAFSTYWLMEKILTLCLQHKNNFKNKIFYQSKSCSITQTFSQYSQEVSFKGAFLFIVMKGRFSQGINFTDSLCRCLIVIGIPFLPRNQQSIQQKLNYISQNYSSQQSDQWYMNQTFLSVNQTIGRVIRNKNDYGIILLIDKRYQKKDNFYRMSQWFQESLRQNNVEGYQLMQQGKTSNLYKEIQEFFKKESWKQSYYNNNENKIQINNYNQYQKIYNTLQKEKDTTKVKKCQKYVNVNVNLKKRKHLKLKLDSDTQSSLGKNKSIKVQDKDNTKNLSPLYNKKSGKVRQTTQKKLKKVKNHTKSPLITKNSYTNSNSYQINSRINLKNKQKLKGFDFSNIKIKDQPQNKTKYLSKQILQSDKKQDKQKETSIKEKNKKQVSRKLTTDNIFLDYFMW